MKRHLIGTIVPALLVAIVAACGDDEGDVATNATTDGGTDANVDSTTSTGDAQPVTDSSIPDADSGTPDTGVDAGPSCAVNNGGCHADALCSGSSGTVVCTCKPGYAGDGGACSDIDECATNNGGCSPNATCANTPGGRTCTCTPPFGGDGGTCMDSVDNCAPNPCQNGGTCADGLNTFTCTCAPGYSGTTCQTNINECSPNPCQNGGTCTDGVNSFTCACAPGYSGTTCQTNINECSPNPCQNGGTCTDGVNSFTCACTTGYAGATCASCAPGYQDNDSNNTCSLACAPATCNSHGSCVDTTGTAVCTCSTGWAGAACDTCAPNFTGAQCDTCVANMAGPNCDYARVYGLDIPLAADWNVAANVPYDYDQAGAPGAFTRVAYRLTLDAQTVWVEMDAFTANKSEVGMPVDWVFDQAVTNVTVISTSPNTPSVSVPTNGTMEFWSYCYGTAGGNGGLYDYDDQWQGQSVDCYGSLQIHIGTNTVFAYNRWAGGGNSDIGFGNQVGGSGHPDWTFAQNTPSFTTRRLDVFVK